MLHPVDQAIHALVKTRPENTQYLIAYSGGLDSSVLLFALAKLKTKSLADISVVHVNHQLQAVASDWVIFCESQCAHLGLNCHTAVVNIDQDSGDSLEALARQERYKVFAQYMHANMCLLTAHHADDQVETFLLQLFRGAGPKGLSAMALQKSFQDGQHARPLLNLSREQLEDYAAINQIDYIQDPSNEQLQFDRNFLRNEIIPLIKTRYPNVHKAVNRSAEHVAHEHNVLGEFLDKKLQDLLVENTLDLNAWLSVAADLQALLLRKWVSDAQLQLPSTKILNDVLLQLKHVHGESKTKITWADVEIRAYSEKIFLLAKIDEVAYLNSAGSLIENTQVFQLPEGYGELSFALSQSESLSLRLEFRSGGEKLRLPRHKHHISLKQLCQKNRVLPWMRSRIPLLFDGEVLVAIGDLWLNADWLDEQKAPDFSVKWANRPQLFAPKGKSQIEA